MTQVQCIALLHSQHLDGFKKFLGVADATLLSVLDRYSRMDRFLDQSQSEQLSKVHQVFGGEINMKVRRITHTSIRRVHMRSIPYLPIAEIVRE